MPRTGAAAAFKPIADVCPVCIPLLLVLLCQAVDRWCGRYPQDVKASLSALQEAPPGSRAWLAAAVVSGEQLLLQQLKKEALMIMLAAAEVGVRVRGWLQCKHGCVVQMSSLLTCMGLPVLVPQSS